jgi:hypothetical protein
LGEVAQLYLTTTVGRGSTRARPRLKAHRMCSSAIGTLASRNLRCAGVHARGWRHTSRA